MSPVTQAAVNALEAGREAARRRAWRDAHDLLRRADEDGGLTGEDLEKFVAVDWR